MPSVYVISSEVLPCHFCDVLILSPFSFLCILYVLHLFSFLLFSLSFLIYTTPIYVSPMEEIFFCLVMRASAEMSLFFFLRMWSICLGILSFLWGKFANIPERFYHHHHFYKIYLAYIFLLFMIFPFFRHYTCVV